MASWIAIYGELSSVLRLVQARLDGDTQGVADFQRKLTFVDARLGLWRDRHQALAGVTIDRADRSLTFGGRYLKLTRREADLLDFLVQHPHRHFTTRQLTVLAWQNPSLSDAQVRNYVMRLRRKLREVGLEDMVTIVRNRGYRAELPKPTVSIGPIGTAP